MIDARDRSGKLVAEAFMVRYHPQWRRARELARDGSIGELRAIQTFFSYRLLDPANVRNRPPGGGGLYDIGCYAILTARYIFAAEPTRVVATIDRDPKFKTDRLASAILEFPGGRCLTFTVGTQLSAHQRVTIVGDAGRIEVLIPFNAPLERPAEIAIDTGVDLIGGGRRVEQFATCDQYTLQGDAFSRAIVDGSPLEFPNRGRDRQHAGHRRPVPLRQERIVGEAVSAEARLRPRGVNLMPQGGPAEAGPSKDRSSRRERSCELTRPLRQAQGKTFEAASRRLRTRSAYRRERKSRIISRAALWPGAPVTPPPGWVEAPHMYKPGTGER